MYRICEWSIKWDLPLNAVKSHLLTRMPSDFQLFIRQSGNIDTAIPSKDQTSDLGVRFSNNFTPTHPSEAAAAKARQALFRLKSAIVNKSPEVFVPLYSAFVRPHLEYCVQAWAPYLRKDVNILEKVQKLATRMVWGTKGLRYPDRLTMLNLFSLERRRLRGDLIEVFKATQHWESSAIAQLFVLRRFTGLRGHKFTLEKSRSSLAVRHNFFTNRVVNAWNKLPSNLVDCQNVDSFKKCLDRAWLDLFPDTM